MDPTEQKKKLMETSCQIEEELHKDKPSFATICHLIQEKNRNYAMAYFKQFKRSENIEIFNEIFRRKLAGEEIEQKASLGGLFFKVYKERLDTNDEKKARVQGLLKKMGRKKKIKKEKNRKATKSIRKEGLMNSFKDMTIE